MPRLVAMCGRNEAKVLDTARRFGYAGVYADWRQMLEDPEIQIIDVCTPDNEHAPLPSRPPRRASTSSARSRWP